MFYVKVWLVLVALCFLFVLGVKKSQAGFDDLVAEKEVVKQGICYVPLKTGESTFLPCVELVDPKQPKKRWTVLFDQNYTPLMVIEDDNGKKKVVWQLNWTDI